MCSTELAEIPFGFAGGRSQRSQRTDAHGDEYNDSNESAEAGSEEEFEELTHSYDDELACN